MQSSKFFLPAEQKRWAAGNQRRPRARGKIIKNLFTNKGSILAQAILQCNACSGHAAGLSSRQSFETNKRQPHWCCCRQDCWFAFQAHNRKSHAFTVLSSATMHSSLRTLEQKQSAKSPLHQMHGKSQENTKKNYNSKQNASFKTVFLVRIVWSMSHKTWLWSDAAILIGSSQTPVRFCSARGKEISFTGNSDSARFHSTNQDFSGSFCQPATQWALDTHDPMCNTGLPTEHTLYICRWSAHLFTSAKFSRFIFCTKCKKDIRRQLNGMSHDHFVHIYKNKKRKKRKRFDTIFTNAIFDLRFHFACPPQNELSKRRIRYVATSSHANCTKCALWVVAWQ